MDSDNNNTITYKEYYEYCSRNAKETANEDDKNDKRTQETKKAIDEYVKSSSAEPEGMIETEA